MSTESIFAVLRYPDAHDAAVWLCRAYGFEVHDIIEQDEANQPCIVLRYGESYVIIAPTDSVSLEDYMIQPADTGNRSTQVCYISVEEIDQHYARACTVGARIELPLTDRSEDGDRVYLSRDPEGHLWSFGPRPTRETVKAVTRADATVNAQVKTNPSTGTIYRLVSVLAGGIAILLLASILFFKDDAVTGVLASLSLEQGDLKASERHRASASERREVLFIEREGKTARAEAEKLNSQLTISRLAFVRAVREKETAESTLFESTKRFEMELAEGLAELEDLSVAKQQVSAQLERHRLLVANYRSDLKKIDGDLQHLRGKTKGLSSEAQALRAERDELSAALEKARRSLAETNQHSARTKVAEQELRQSLADVKAKYSKAVEHGKLAESKLQSTRTALKQRVNNQQSTINAIKKTNSDITRALAAERAAAIKLRDERAAANDSAARLHTEGKHLKREMNQLKERLVVLTTAQQEVERLRAESGHLASQTKSLTAQIAALEKARLLDRKTKARRSRRRKTAPTSSRRISRATARTARSKSLKPKPDVGYVQVSPIPRDPRRRRELLSSIYDCDATVNCD